LIVLPEIGMRCFVGRFAGTAIGLASTLGMLGAFIGSPLGNSTADIRLGAPFAVWGAMTGITLVAMTIVYRGKNVMSPEPK